MNNTFAPAWRLIGFWMVAAVALLQGFYGVWAFVDPEALAVYRGASIEMSTENWVHAYGSRTLFVACVVLLLLGRGNFETLKWVALVGIIMPVSDAWTAIQATAPPVVILRHAGTAIFLLITFAMLTRALRKARPL